MKLIIPNMTCSHCVISIQKKLLISRLDAKVELKDKSVRFVNDSDFEKIKAAIISAGFTVKL